MNELNLPAYEVRIKEENGKRQIFDVLRRKYVALTPEEWVRQHFIHFLIEHKHYPPTLLNNEIGISLNGTSKRCDSVLFDTKGQPLMIVEYKAPTVQITQKVFNQILRYNMVLHVRYLTVSNGINHYCCEIDPETGEAHFLQDIPEYDKM